MSEPQRPLLRWHGGKWRLAPWIVEHFPAHRIYVEPFGGAGSVLLRKPRAYAEVWNDLDGEVVNLFRVLRSQRAGELIDLLRLTPFAREEFLDAFEDHDDPVEKARRLVVRSYQGFGTSAIYRKATGFRSNSMRRGSVPAHDWATYPPALDAVITRLAGCIIENRDAVEIMRIHDTPETLHYCDPPYVHSTRGRDRGSDSAKHRYAVEMSDDEHRQLLGTLCGLVGMVALSGYPHPIYDESLTDWRRIERTAMADGARPRVECLWINPACAAALDTGSGAHVDIFDRLGEFSPC